MLHIPDHSFLTVVARLPERTSCDDTKHTISQNYGTTHCIYYIQFPIDLAPTIYIPMFRCLNRICGESVKRKHDCIVDDERAIFYNIPLYTKDMDR